MGQAKLRKESDPLFGRVPKDSYERGLIISPPIEIEGSSLLVKSSDLDSQELRFALLFWDKLVWPSSRVIYFDGGADEEFLKSAGVLSRPEYTFDGDVALGVAKSQMAAFQDLDRSEPGSWALSTGERSFNWKDGEVKNDSGTLIELHKAIPIPRHDVPLEEILEFKRRRRDELLLFRHHVESLAADVKKAGDQQAELNKKMAEIDQACSNLLIVSREWQFPVYLSSYKTTLNLSPKAFMPWMGAAGTFAAPFGMAATTAASLVAGLLATIEFKAEPAFRPVRVPTSPYKYAYRIGKELI